MFFFRNSIFKNFSSLSLNTFVFTFQQLIYVPLFIYFWNAEIYAEWLILFTIPSILAYTELGIGSYAANLIVIAFNTRAKNRVNLIFQNCSNFIFIFILIGSIIFYIINYLFDIYFFLKVKSISNYDFYFVVLFLILKFYFTTQTSLNLSLLKAVHKYHYLNNFKSLFILSEIIFVTLILINKGNIYSVALVSAINYFVAAILSYIYIKNKFDWFKYEFKKFSFTYFKQIIYPSFSFMIPGLCKAIMIQSTIILISTTNNPSLVVFYNSLRIILNGVRQVVSIISNSFFPEFTIYLAKKNWSQIQKKLILLIKISTAISITSTLLILFFVKIPFIIWTNNEVEWNNIFFLILLIATTVDWLNVPIHSFPYSINKHTLLINSHLSALFIYLFLILILFDIYEIYSIPISLLISNLFFLIWNVLIVDKILKNKSFH
jgi:O-antigen/teichoic acid export membrane protein